MLQRGGDLLMNRIMWFSMVLMAVLPVMAQAKLTLAKGGHTRYTIVISPDASPAVQQAAREFAADMRQITGAAFPVANSAASGPKIFIGPGAALSASFPGLFLQELPPEGFIIRTHGNDLALAGHDDRGTLYAVYTFLEEHLGARWYAPDATLLPKHRVVVIPELNEKQFPAFAYRDTDEHLVFGSAPWDAHLKLDGTSVPDDPNYGGINRLFNGAENFYELVPPSVYFATHPEYYSLINGKRSDAGDSQLCLSNPDVLRIVTDKLVAQAQQDPKLLTLGFSPNDAGDGNCQCDLCKASDAKYGAPSGTLIAFVNKLAAAVQAKLPDRKIWIETLAYEYTEKPPTPGAIGPVSNVLICLAPINMCFSHSIASDPVNKSVRDNLLNWNKAAPGHLQVWHYVTNFANYIQPFPDWDELGADMDYYHEHGVSGVFCEGDYNSQGEMMAMRTWVIAHLLWNPKQDVWALVRDFCKGYYGAAGSSIYQYLRLLHDQLQQQNVHLYIYDSPNASYLSPTMLKKANQLFDQAQSAVKSHPDELSRVQEARMGIRYVELMRGIPSAQSNQAAKEAFHTVLTQFTQDLQRFHMDYIAEGRPTSDWLAAIQKQSPTGYW
jgi:hypothetical protein